MLGGSIGESTGVCYKNKMCLLARFFLFFINLHHNNISCSRLIIAGRIRLNGVHSAVTCIFVANFVVEELHF